MLLALAACGQAPSIVLTLDAASAELIRGTDVQVQVTLTRAGGASADVALSVTGLPAHVTANFSPAILSGGTLTSTLTVAVASSAAGGNYALAVTGTGTGLTDVTELAIDVISLGVTGRVVSGGLPVIGATVTSQGVTQVTDSTGKFNVTGLSVPYDLSVWSAADEWVQIYEGLTADELLLAPATAPGLAALANLATVSGNLSGGVIPVGANQVVTVCIEGVDGRAFGCDTVAPTESDYSLSAIWIGDATQAIRIHALQFEQDLDGYPVAYLGYASLAMTVTDAVPTVADLDLGGALATTTVDVEVVSPVAIVSTIGAVRVGPNLTVLVMQVDSPATTHDALMPVMDDASYTFIAGADITQFGWQADVTGTTATVIAPGATQLISPADLAIGVTTATNFTVSNPTGGPNTFIWDADVGGLSIGLTTMASTHSIPDISVFGLALPAGADFDWQVFSQSGISTEGGTNGFGDYHRLFQLLSGSGLGFTGEGTYALSDSRSVTTAP